MINGYLPFMSISHYAEIFSTLYGNVLPLCQKTVQRSGRYFQYPFVQKVINFFIERLFILIVLFFRRNASSFQGL